MPLPTHRLAAIALRSLKVDAELSPLVQRSFYLARPGSSLNGTVFNGASSLDTSDGRPASLAKDDGLYEKFTVLKTEYKATTNRMLRVAVNGFMESLGVVLGVMEELDVDVLEEEG